MADKIIALLAKLATGRWVIVFLLLVIAFNFALKWIYPSFPTLDIQSSYSPEKAYQLISSYGEAGRREYIVTELTVDIIYPILWPCCLAHSRSISSDEYFRSRAFGKSCRSWVSSS